MITEKEVATAPTKIGDLEFTLLYSKVGKKDLGQGDGVSQEPLVNIYLKDKNIPNTYIVNIVSYIGAEKRKNLTPKQLQSGFPINKKVALRYNEKIANINTEIKEGVTCRDFKIIYDAPEEQATFNKVEVQFEYTLLDNTAPVEAIIVRDKDLDPGTDRGTVTTPYEPEGPGQA
ncbi:hypothetical protein [Flavicella sp.]|uniref:hypothetical protein n=1 Tax=Flavicella sp. TaxID=2957742 RepID=UPI0026263BA6|nr:hypothetical protein [Flavicella sp.]MDG1806238.1 hypothetical protein [Flavicella sp.]